MKMYVKYMQHRILRVYIKMIAIFGRSSLEIDCYY